MPVILGIDPGSRATGYGVLSIEGKTIRYLDSGVIRIKAEAVSDRLLEIFSNIQEVIGQYNPDQGAIEQVFMHQNPGSALKLGQARGVAMVAMADKGLPVSEYSARQVKLAVVGYGGADKSQVGHMVKTILNLSKAPQEDAADALAIALCHYHTSQSLAKYGEATKVVRGRLR